eukprot:TRINITY_DN33004_c1_g1_i1.p1 TRINITY_DN33004_c1_g1~~TRINITY_DN33004_c1_g1_i1.p1  ORF type:complete len:228 (-),score=29.30 TRINITY_DN33004_c1_g1_i1:329-1012(-)
MSHDMSGAFAGTRHSEVTEASFSHPPWQLLARMGKAAQDDSTAYASDMSWGTSDGNSSRASASVCVDSCSASTGSYSSSRLSSGCHRKKKAGKRRDEVPVFVPGTKRLFSNGSKNHCQGRCRPCYMNTLEQQCPAGMACNFCHFDHDTAKLVETEAWSIRRQAQKRRALDAATLAAAEAAMPSLTYDWEEHALDDSSASMPTQPMTMPYQPPPPPYQPAPGAYRLSL